MNRTFLYLIIFLLLGGATLWMLTQSKKDEKTTLLGADRKFKIENPETIQRIFIADRQGNNTTLERQGDDWIYNGKYKARPNVMENLLDAITRVQIKYQPPKQAVAHMITSLATEGIKVEIYGERNKLLKSYYVGGSTSDERGTFMMMADAEQPYVANIPNWSGNIRFRYNLKDDDWRDISIFSHKIESINKVEVEYPKQRNKSFKITREGKEFTVAPYFEITPKINEPLLQGKIEQYLVGFEQISSRGFDNKNPEKDSISETIPFCRIALEDIKGKTTNIDMYPIQPDQEFDEKTGEPLPLGEVQNYYAVLNDEDFIVISQRVIQNLLWAYEFFYQ